MSKPLSKARVLCTVLSLILIGVPSAGHARGKSPAGAAALSLVLPGLGEFYAGGRRSARFFLVTEGIFWSGMATFRFLESYRVDAYHAHAAAHAGIRLKNFPESYIKEVGDFDSIYERNRRERFLAGEHANIRAETAGNTWEWDSEASRIEFLDLNPKLSFPLRTRNVPTEFTLFFNADEVIRRLVEKRRNFKNFQFGSHEVLSSASFNTSRPHSSCFQAVNQ